MTMLRPKLRNKLPQPGCRNLRPNRDGNPVSSDARGTRLPARWRRAFGSRLALGSEWNTGRPYTARPGGGGRAKSRSSIFCRPKAVYPATDASPRRTISGQGVPRPGGGPGSSPPALRRPGPFQFALYMPIRMLRRNLRRCINNRRTKSWKPGRHAFARDRGPAARWPMIPSAAARNLGRHHPNDPHLHWH